MINLKFSRLPKYRKFNYTPVFYNEAKEELHSPADDIKPVMGEEARSKDKIKDNIRRAYKAKQLIDRYGTAPGNKLYVARIAAIAVILTVIFYYIWDSTLLKIIFEGLSK